MSASSFDRGAFEDGLAEIGEMLGELWAIDELVRWVEHNPEGEYGPSVGGWYQRITVGERYPFEFEAPEGSWGPLLISGRNWSGQVVESVRSLTWTLVRTDSAPFEDAVNAFRSSVVDQLRYGVADDFAGLSNNLGSWKGDAADAFGDWYGRLEFIARRQTHVAECVCMGIAASKAVVDLGHHSLQEIVDQMRVALDQQLAGRAQKHGLPPANSAYVAVILGATILGALAAIPTGGASIGAAGALAATAGVTSQLLTFAATQVPPEEGVAREPSLGSADEFFHELSDSVAQVLDHVRSQWQGVESVVQDLIAGAESAAGQDLLAPVRPRVVRRTPTPDGFHHESAPR